jgi:hypothetical protein
MHRHVGEHQGEPRAIVDGPQRLGLLDGDGRVQRLLLDQKDAAEHREQGRRVRLSLDGRYQQCLGMRPLAALERLVDRSAVIHGRQFGRRRRLLAEGNACRHAPDQERAGRDRQNTACRRVTASF